MIAIDLAGHRQRDKPHVDYSMAYFVPIYRYCHESRENKETVLVVHRMGTPVIRQFNRLFPQETLGRIIVDGALKRFGPKEQM